MSTTFGEIQCKNDPCRKLEVYTGINKDFNKLIRLFIYDKEADQGKKITLTEETWRVLIEALQLAGKDIGWEE